MTFRHWPHVGAPWDQDEASSHLCFPPCFPGDSLRCNWWRWSFCSLVRMGGVVWVWPHLFLWQEVQISQLQQCSFHCCLRWRPNWDSCMLIGVHQSTILPEYYQSRLIWKYTCCFFDALFNSNIVIRKHKCYLGWVLWQRLYLLQRISGSELLSPEQHNRGCHLWSWSQLCWKLLSPGCLALSLGRLYRRLRAALWAGNRWPKRRK